jgi:5-methylcytosine-specific restriction enzyme subunit McrC
VLQPLVDIRPSHTGGEVVLVPRTNVGTIRVGGLRVDVQPRIGPANLVTLIRYAYEGNYVQARSETTPGREGLDELLGCVLADELDMIRQRGVSRLYVNRKQPLRALRGRPDFLASFPWNDRGMTSITCRYHELSCDTLDNRLILAGLESAVLLDLAPKTRSRFVAHRRAWHELATPGTAGPGDFERARSHYNRLTEHYRLAHNIAELIVNRVRPQSLFDTTTHVTSGVSLDMADLFERVVYRLLRDTFEPRGFDVRYQNTDGRALRDGEGERYRNIRPDVLIFLNDVPVAVVDAKYKDYWEADPDRLVPLKKISNEDLYQLFFYASRLQAVHRLSQPPMSIIIAPQPTVDELAGRLVIGERFRRVRYCTTMSEHELSLALLPVATVVDALRQSAFQAGDCEIVLQWASTLGLEALAHG